MRNIADTIKRLNASRTLKSSPLPRNANTRLQPMAEFGQNPGSLLAWIYIPTNFKPGSPLVVVLHGCTQTAAAYDHGSGWSDLADRYGFALLFPEQQRSNNPNLCFNWFAAADTTRGQGEVHSISQMVVSLTHRYCLDRTNICVTGLSAGGAMAAAMLATYPEMFKAGAIIAGLPFGTASNVPEAFDRMRGHGIQEGRILAEKVRQASNHQGPWPAVSVWHGTADRTVDPINMEAIIGQWWHQHDLKDAPRITSQSQRHQCRTWSDNAGITRVEAHTISGMGHGTPIKPGASGLGTPSVFMLDVGISSTWHIANSWNLIGESEIPPVEVAVTSCPPGARDESTRQVNRPVRGVIEDALRAAGLMK
ncbi:extracellular catalytic domain type 1 short-chain-length polyhydroxyalkanoate depolymerase [Phyllobacterium sophorae]|uniref:Esterase n=1 Tax=Phyllobacterium sophorae TaxID=1520277 RepID=A0A2P7B661_9HYPH|nr:PHB depolymerase family esterase [Phyllobacterium sophorae]PSH61929.1 hypothetical protein CU103_21685 [Phyllobacterium sophorae]